MRRMRDGIRLAVKLLNTDAYKEVSDEKIEPSDEILANDDALDLWIRKTVGSARHVSGTCKIGPDSDPMAVVDQECRVKGFMGLWIADYWGDRIYNINEYDGTIINSYPSEGVDPSGVVWDGTNIWYCDNGINYDTDLIYKVEISTSVDAGDINDDGGINILDIVVLVDFILSSNYNSYADLNDDEEINVLDVIILINIILDN